MRFIIFLAMLALSACAAPVQYASAPSPQINSAYNLATTQAQDRCYTAGHQLGSGEFYHCMQVEAGSNASVNAWSVAANRGLAPAASTPSSDYRSPACHSPNYYGAISCVTYQPKTTHVRGYFRRDGTYVRPHYRSRR